MPDRVVVWGGGVPGEVMGDVYTSILELLCRQAERDPEAPALVEPGGVELSFAGLAEQVSGLAGQMLACGMGRGARVAVVMPSDARMSVTLLAVAVGATAAPLSPDYREEEFRRYMTAMRLSHLLVAGGQGGRAADAAKSLGLPVHEVVVQEGGRITLAGTLSETHPGPSDAVVPDADSVALVMMTSGSTSGPKRVPLTHRNLCTSVRDICRSLELGPADRCLSMWEQFHIGGVVDLLLAPLAAGGCVISAGTFDAERFLVLLERGQPTWFQAVPTTLSALVRTARQRGVVRIPSTLRFIRSVAAALSPELKSQIEALFGVPVIQTFGMTEAAPLITSTRLPPGENTPGSVGVSAGPEVAVMGEGGRLLGEGETGEVVVRGDNVMSGYEDSPELNRELFVDGWFRTGDLGYLDGRGQLFLVGRAKELINRGGEKISPVEVDKVLLSHPGVEACGTFAFPHPTLGEEVAAAIVRTGRVALGAEELQAFAAVRLAPFKVPSRLFFVDELPRTATGKIQRHKLAELLAHRIGEEDREVVAPRTPLETALLVVWEEVLQVKGAGVEDAFLDLGGDSIAGVALLAAVEKRLGRRLPPRALRGLTTVSAMAAFIEQGDEGGHVRDGLVAAGLSEEEAQVLLMVLGAGRLPAHPAAPLVKVANREGGRPPLVWCFNAPESEMLKLLRILPEDQPLYGLYSGSGRLDYTGTVTGALAVCYAASVVACLPEGPLFVVGNCRGADVALHMVAELERLGRSVSGLAMVDFFAETALELQTPQLILPGRDSTMLIGRGFRWGRPGWRRTFRVAPQVEWVSGRHGTYFESPNLEDMWRKLDRWLGGKEPDRSPGALLGRYGWLVVRKCPGIRLVYAVCDRMRQKRRAGVVDAHGK